VTSTSLDCATRLLQQLARFDPRLQLPAVLVLLVTAEADLRGDHYTIKIHSGH